MQPAGELVAAVIFSATTTYLGFESQNHPPLAWAVSLTGCISGMTSSRSDFKCCHLHCTDSSRALSPHSLPQSQSLTPGSGKRCLQLGQPGVGADKAARGDAARIAPCRTRGRRSPAGGKLARANAGLRAELLPRNPATDPNACVSLEGTLLCYRLRGRVKERCKPARVNQAEGWVSPVTSWFQRKAGEGARGQGKQAQERTHTPTICISGISFCIYHLLMYFFCKFVQLQF